MYRLSVEARHLAHLTDQGISDAVDSPTYPSPGAVTKFNAWIPLLIVHHALPWIVKRRDEGAQVVG
jgi:hypothetical protein